MLILLATLTATASAAQPPARATPRPVARVTVMKAAAITRQSDGRLSVDQRDHRSQRHRRQIESLSGKKVAADLIEFE